jgi:AbrB family looped-hinge helix DNA binding protein
MNHARNKRLRLVFDLVKAAHFSAGNANTLASIEESYYDARIDMDTVTLSPKFQVVIPQAIREALHLTAGEKLRVLRYDNRVEFIPVRPIQQMRGFLRGMDTSIEREDDRL